MIDDKFARQPFDTGMQAYLVLSDLLVLAEIELDRGALIALHAGIVTAALTTMCIQLGSKDTEQIAKVLVAQMASQAAARTAADIAIQTAQGQ